MTTEMLVLDGYKIRHWLNARKFTNQKAADSSGLAEEEINRITSDGHVDLDGDSARSLAQVLNLPISELVVSGNVTPAVLYQSKAEVLETKREVFRAGMHFYNYYSLPSPQGYVAPVLIDILCPKDRDPVQNNGHLEPAITISLGPNHLYGLWGDKTAPDAWQRLDVNKSDEHSWIVGDSYVEPPYQPHSYSRAEDGPAQILSYTIKSNLEDFVHSTNSWSNEMFGELVENFQSRPAYAAILEQLMSRRGYNADSLSAQVELGGNSLFAYLNGDETALDVADLKGIGKCLGVDYRLLLPPVLIHDSVGKTWCSVEESIRSIRQYESYTVASMSVAPQHSDLMGLFMKVDSNIKNDVKDLIDHSCSHYLVTGGDMVMWYIDKDGEQRQIRLADGDAMWIGPFIRHGFSGKGSLIKMGNGEGLSYLQQLEFSNTYNLSEILLRCRKDKQVWGYDEKP